MCDSSPRGRVGACIYIAGPMSGLPEFNYPAFNDAEALWANQGYVVLNPARNDDGTGTMAYADYCKAGFIQVLKSDIVALLPGWENSRGAILEFQLAAALDLEVWILNKRGSLAHVLMQGR